MSRSSGRLPVFQSVDHGVIAIARGPVGFMLAEAGQRQLRQGREDIAAAVVHAAGRDQQIATMPSIAQLQIDGTPEGGKLGLALQICHGYRAAGAGGQVLIMASGRFVVFGLASS